MNEPKLLTILVTGASGGLGRYVTASLKARRHNVLTPTRSEMDITDARCVYGYIKEFNPSYVVHLAAIANVDTCEKDPALAIWVSIIGTQNIINAMPPKSVMFMSSNDVFSECKFQGPYKEQDVPNPGMTYSLTKYAGEKAVLSKGGLCLRANFFTRFCNSKQSFAGYVINSALSDQECPCYTDVQASPLFAGSLADVFSALMYQENLYGSVIHVGSSNSVNRFEQARLICEAYKLPSNKIVPVELGENRRNGRPLDARLDVSWMESILRLKLNVKEEISKMVQAEPLTEVQTVEQPKITSYSHPLSEFNHRVVDPFATDLRK